MKTEFPNTPPETLYHYCSVEAFKAIIESKKLRLSDALSMNDYLETRWAQTKISHVCDKYEQNIPKQTQYFFNNLIDESLGLFLFCLSYYRDILSQWRAYTNNGEGFCIGFNTKCLDIPPWPPRAYTSNLSNLVIHMVNYDESDQEHIIEKKMGPKIYTPHRDEDWGCKSTGIKGIELKTYASVFKNPHFSEEVEWRIVYDETMQHAQKYFDLSKVKFRTRGNDIIRYYELDFPTPHADLITEVVKGPKNKIHDNVIDQFLQENGFTETKIESSKISYR